MRIGRPFTIPQLRQNDGDSFVPLYTRCQTCGKPFRIIASELFASSALYGSRTLDCYGCGPYWADVFEPLGEDERRADRPVMRVSI